MFPIITDFYVIEQLTTGGGNRAKKLIKNNVVDNICQVFVTTDECFKFAHSLAKPAIHNSKNERRKSTDIKIVYNSYEKQTETINFR